MVISEECVGSRLGLYKFRMMTAVDTTASNYWRGRILEEMDKFRQNVRMAFPGNQSLEDGSMEHLDLACERAFSQLREGPHYANPI